MKLNTTDFPRKAQLVLTLALGSYPVTMLLLANLAPGQLAMAPVWPAALALLSWLCILLPGRMRIPGGILSSLALVGLSTLLPIRTEWLLAFLPVMHIALLIVTLPVAGWERSRELNAVWHILGLLTHIGMQLLVSGAQRIQLPTYDGLQLPLLASFLVYMALSLLALNRSSLESAAQSRRRVPLLMRRQNTVLTLGMLLVGVGVAAIPSISEALNTAWSLALKAVGSVIAFIVSLIPMNAGSGGGSGGSADMDMGFGPAAEPSPLALLMEKILRVVALGVIILGALALAYFLGKRLWRLAKRLLQGMLHYGMAASEDYEDEITDTRDEPDTQRDSLLTRLRRYTPEEKSTDPTQRVRSCYRRLMRRRDWSRASTARENLPDDAARLYEQARYSGQPLTPHDADRFHDATRNT